MVGWSAIWHPWKTWQRLPRDQALNGDWWRPGSPEPAVPGKLTIPQFGHPQLHFEGGNELFGLPFLGEFDVLHGRIWELGNTPATVLRSVATPRGHTYALNKPDPKQIQTIDVTINLLLIGRHLNSEDEQSSISTASLISPYLHGWGQFEGLSDPLMLSEQPGYNVQFTPQSTGSIRVSDSTIVSFECILHRSGAMIFPNKIDLNQHTLQNCNSTRRFPFQRCVRHSKN